MTPDASDDAAASVAVCSAKGCRQPAVVALVWRNPRLHTADRRKRWVACADHRDSLAAFLDARRFLLGVEPLDGPWADRPG